MMNNCLPALIITAAGSSLRMGGEKKEYLPLGAGTVLSEAVKQFCTAVTVSRIVITYPADGIADDARAALAQDSSLAPLLSQTTLLFTAGGNTRQESVYHALEALEPFSPDIVLIHDGARPFVDEKTITATLAAAERYGAAVPALLPADTIKTVNADNTVAQHLDRTTVRAVQTPQGFRFAPLLAAHRKAAAADRAYTDDSEIWGTFVGTVKLTAGSPENRKITYRSDIPDDTSVLPRIGFGYDLHRLVPGRKLLIGGVCIPAEKGEDAHSDGDVLLHAITDAVLGAAGCGDIGSYFPPTDMRWHNADSAQLLQTAWHDVQNAGWELGNIDAVIKLERPAFLPHRDAVRDSIAVLFSVPRDAIFVKAKTGEGLGDVGSGDAIEAWAHCLLFKRKHYRQETPSH